MILSVYFMILPSYFWHFKLPVQPWQLRLRLFWPPQWPFRIIVLPPW